MDKNFVHYMSDIKKRLLQSVIMPKTNHIIPFIIISN